MSVWFAVMASMSFVYMVSPCFELGTAGKVICAIVHSISFVGGMAYDSHIIDKIKKLEKEVKKLKGNE